MTVMWAKLWSFPRHLNSFRVTDKNLSVLVSDGSLQRKICFANGRLTMPEFFFGARPQQQVLRAGLKDLGFVTITKTFHFFSSNGQLKVLSKKIRITNVGLGNRVVRLPQLQQIDKTENCKSKSKNFKFQEVKNGKSFIKKHLQGLSQRIRSC